MLFGILAVLAVFYFLVNPIATNLVPQCPFYRLTGWYCPGCGMQRALHALLHGHLWEAFCLNPYLALMTPFFLIVGYESTFATGKTKAFIIRYFENKWTFLLFVVITFSWWIIRNL